MLRTGNKKTRGFSLIELVIVVVIIAIIGAIAIPRMSRGASGAGDAALIQNLSVLRTAIDLYQTEHGGTFPSTATQLTMYSDSAGATSATKDPVTGKVYGPYLRVIPPLPVGADKGKSTFTGPGYAAGFGWVYNSSDGSIIANTSPTEKDDSNKLYSTY